MKSNAQKYTSVMMRIWQKKMGMVILISSIAIFLLITKTATPDTQVIEHQHPVQKTIPESQLNTVYLDDDSYRKLGITIERIRPQKITVSKTYGGEIIVPGGGVVTVSAPLSGKLITLDKSPLKPGDQVKSGQLLYRIQPMITADTRANLVNTLADAESLVKVAQSQADATEVALRRAKKLLSDLAGSQRNVDDAYAAHEIALRNLDAARVKKNAIHQMLNSGSLEAIEIKSPQTGIISNIFAINEQMVSAGSPMVEISSLSALWLRVPVPAGDFELIDQQANAEIHLLSAKSEDQGLLATPINAPPTADPLTGTTHLYYAVEMTKTALHPMQRVSATLNLRSKTDLVSSIPHSAVVFDINGGSWVYIQPSKNVYERKRVFIDHVVGQRALIIEGPPEGSNIVVNGALELFSVETGFSH